MSMNRCVVLAAGMFAAAICDSASGADFYLKPGATDWSTASSYCTDAGRKPPKYVKPRGSTFSFGCIEVSRVGQSEK